MPVKFNTHFADICELATCYYLSGKHWTQPEYHAQFYRKALLISRTESKQKVVDQINRGRVIAETAEDFFHGIGSITAVYWVARIGTQTTAMYPDISSMHPADILIQCQTDILTHIWFGISIKSTNGTSDIAFKNMGYGTLERLLHIDIKSIVQQAVEEIILKWHLPMGADNRKAAIRSSETIANDTRQRGSRCLHDVRNKMLNALWATNPDTQHTLLKVLLDITDNVTPPWVKITGFGTKEKGYSAHLQQPYETLPQGQISIESVGNEGIGFRCGMKKMCVLRLKFESEQLASTLKSSTDPWS